MKNISLILTLTACSLLSSCTNNSGMFPQVADAPPFDYVDGEELRSRMHQLAFELQRLDSELSSNYAEDTPIQRSVVDSLDDIERIAQTLQSGDLTERHPFLTDDMDDFLSDVSRAKFDAERNRYYMAGRVSGACVTCHKANY